MHRAPGVGLAASQVGVEKRLAVVDVSVGQDPAALGFGEPKPRLAVLVDKGLHQVGTHQMPTVGQDAEGPHHLHAGDGNRMPEGHAHQ